MMRPVVKALLFDVQGTATDFHSTVCDEAQRISAGRHPGVDWPDVVRRWRAGYFAVLEAAQSRPSGWVSVHSVYRHALDTVVDECGIHFSDAEREELTLAWRRLKPWPDVVPGLTRLKSAYTLATLSNADVSTVINISKRAGLPWDAVKQRRFDRLMAVLATVNSMLPRVVRQFPFNLMLWDLDRRIRTGRPLV